MAVASGVTLEIDPSVVPVREETAVLCRTADVDPLRVFGSGALLAAVPEAGIDAVTGRLDDRGIDNAVIGAVRDAAEPALRLGDERLTEPVRDEMYALWE
jgi:hydrogenase expression/formation protein HypE